jgi:hypothetical protein
MRSQSEVRRLSGMSRALARAEAAKPPDVTEPVVLLQETVLPLSPVTS